MNRRNLLYTTTALVAAAGVVAAAWPMLDQMNPDAGTKAATDFLDYDLTAVHPGEQRTVRWRAVPVFVALRTAHMLAAMQEPSFVSQLIDPESRKSRQPVFAENWHRSLDPTFAVLVGICASCSCIPQYLTETSALDLAGSYICPCCATHYDPAGRAYSGLARFNLIVPPYEIARGPRLLLGKGDTGAVFSLDSFARRS